jgi:hypothetical protein
LLTYVKDFGVSADKLLVARKKCIHAWLYPDVNYHKVAVENQEKMTVFIEKTNGCELLQQIK